MLHTFNASFLDNEEVVNHSPRLKRAYRMAHLAIPAVCYFIAAEHIVGILI